MREFKLTAKTFSGLESVLANELKDLGAKNIRQGNRAVFFEGTLETVYKSNYFLRTALRILKEISFFQFKNTEQFYLRCKQVNWNEHFDIGQSFAINSVVVNSNDFKNSMYASLRVKDAIADYFREKLGKRPNVNVENPDIYINVFINKDRCSLALDSSGESLHKRGYRVIQGEAPLNEVLAAGMILLTGWKGNCDFMDPMCGSGTLPIEAAMIAYNVPAGKFRKNYAFENWPDYNDLLFDKIKQSELKKDFHFKIFASDISASSLLNAQTNARRALVFNKIQFKKSNFKDLDIPLKNGIMIINPPYGERLKEMNLNDLYQMIGERLKHNYSGNIAWILSSSAENIKFLGLKPAAKSELYNGSLKCQYNRYKMFEGKWNVYKQR